MSLLYQGRIHIDFKSLDKHAHKIQTETECVDNCAYVRVYLYRKVPLYH